MMRLDLYLSNYGYVKSRQKAQELIKNGNVKINSKIIFKPSYEIDENSDNDISVSDPCPYVSRGGLKLEKVICDGNINVFDKIAIDIGASTGGFTDCLLKNGAKKVYAIDSGSNQLDLSLLNDNRVVSLENYNARNICIEDIGQKVDVITIDVSFISQTYILPSAVSLLKENGIYISLIKPQFEVGKERIDKGGIVKKPQNRLLAVLKVIECANNSGMFCNYFSKSPILGGDGNIEYIAMFSKNVSNIDKEFIKKTIME